MGPHKKCFSHRLVHLTKFLLSNITFKLPKNSVGSTFKLESESEHLSSPQYLHPGPGQLENLPGLYLRTCFPAPTIPLRVHLCTALLYPKT